MKYFNLVFLVSLFTFSCQDKSKSVLSAFRVYCEMVANDAKPMALHYPMPPSEVEELWAQFQEIAQSYEVNIYQEDSFPNSLLFPGNATEGKSVILIYKGARLTQYQQWRRDLEKNVREDIDAQIMLARRFGRLLGYTSQGINGLLRKNSAYRNLSQFKVQKQITHLYYEDHEEGLRFYGQTLGLPKVDSATFQIGKDAFITINLVNESHPANQSKSTAIALLTDQLPEWYQYVQDQGIPIKYTYKPKEGGPHDGFVAIDPAGYLLEFEEFKQHPENELFMATLFDAPKVETLVSNLGFFGSITWSYHKDLLKMQQFYEETLGFKMVADQGWTKIYQTSNYGFIGLVDERRGMEDYSDTKAVEIEWQIEELESFQRYAIAQWPEYKEAESQFTGPEKYIYRVNKVN